MRSREEERGGEGKGNGGEGKVEGGRECLKAGIIGGH